MLFYSLDRAYCTAKEGVHISKSGFSFHAGISRPGHKIRIRGMRLKLLSLLTALSLLPLVSSCGYQPLSDEAYQTLASAFQNNIAQLLPTVVPQEGQFYVSDQTNVQEIGSKQDLFFVLQDSLYNFVPEVYIQIENYDLFSEYWQELSADGALHSAFETSEVQIEYNDQSPCTMRLMFQYNSAGQILRSIHNNDNMIFPDSDVQSLYDKAMGILGGIITADMSDLQKESAIHDYIVTHTKYSIEGDADKLASAESVLIDGSGQCQGYAEAMSLLLGLSGIPSKIISGSARGADGTDVAHAWNLVSIDGRWYHVDVTWDDPVPDTGDYASRTYMNRSDDFMRTDHTWSDLFQACPVDSPTNAPDSAVDVAAA